MYIGSKFINELVPNIELILTLNLKNDVSVVARPEKNHNCLQFYRYFVL